MIPFLSAGLSISSSSWFASAHPGTRACRAAIPNCHRSTGGSLDNNKSEQPACDKVIVALCASLREAWQQVPNINKNVAAGSPPY
jgi:hypothetical protein